MPEQDPERPIYRPPTGDLAPETSQIRRWSVVEPKEIVLRKRLWTWLIVLLLLGVGAFSVARPVYQRVKVWRGRWLAEESLKLLAGGKQAEAAQKAQAAYRLAPRDPQAMRALAHWLTGAGELRQAVAFRERLVASGQSVDEDREALIDGYLKSQRYPQAQEQLDKLVALSGRNPKNLILSARLNLARGEQPAALVNARDAVKLAPAEDPARIFLAALKLESEATATEAEEELIAISTKKTLDGLHALAVLANSPDLSLQMIDRVATALEGHPMADEIHRLKALELHGRANPGQREALLDQAEARYSQSAADPKIKSKFAELLLTVGEPERVLKLLPIEQSLARREWLILHLDALAALRRWEGMMEALEKGGATLPTPVVELYRARCAEELGDLPGAKEHWQRGLRSTAGRADLLLYYAQYAEKAGRVEDARTAYRALERVPEAAAFAKEKLDRIEK